MKSIRKYLKTNKIQLCDLPSDKNQLNYINTRFSEESRLKFKSFLNARLLVLDRKSKYGLRGINDCEVYNGKLRFRNECTSNSELILVGMIVLNLLKKRIE